MFLISLFHNNFGGRFLIKMLSKRAAKVSDFYCTVTCEPHLGSVVTSPFWGCYECFPHELKDIVDNISLRQNISHSLSILVQRKTTRLWRDTSIFTGKQYLYISTLTKEVSLWRKFTSGKIWKDTPQGLGNSRKSLRPQYQKNLLLKMDQLNSDPFEILSITLFFLIKTTVT